MSKSSKLKATMNILANIQILKQTLLTLLIPGFEWPLFE